MNALTVARDSAQNLPARFARRRWTAAAAAAAAYARMGASKHIAATDDVHVSTVTRFRQGAPFSPLAKVFQHYAKSPRISAWAALTEAYVVVNIEEIEDASPEQLCARRAELEMVEADIARDLVHARHVGGDVRALRARQADVVLELVAIETALQEPAS